MHELPHTHGCFVCGESNPIGFRLRFHTDGRIVQTRFTPRTEHCGFKSTMHGGLISTVLDELMAWVCIVELRGFAYCAELSTRFLKPVSPGTELLATGQLLANRRGRVLEVASELTDSSGTVYAKASGKYIPIANQEQGSMVEDLVGTMPEAKAEGGN